MKFTDFNFHPYLQEGLDAMNYATTTPIQAQAIPVIREGKDLIACAQTGTGKTASFLLPVLDKLSRNPHTGIDTLILVPTRELALQIDQQIMGLAYFTGSTSIAVYGGGDGISYEQQRRALTEGVNIIVATPGRLISNLTTGGLNLKQLKHFVLDEADRMMDMGFYDDIMKIRSYLPEKIQTVMFSATMPPKIRTMSKKILHQPEEINIAISKPSEGIDQQAYMVFDEQKPRVLNEVLANENYKSIIIFSSRKETVKKLYQQLLKGGFMVEAFHSDLEQEQRESIMQRFKADKIRVIVATDVISRGIDVEGISLVINYDVPPDPEDYIHRIGRTARAERKGTAITFVNEKEQYRFFKIERLMEREVSKMVLSESFGAVPEYQPEKFKSTKRKKKKNFKGKRNPADKRRQAKEETGKT